MDGKETSRTGGLKGRSLGVLVWIALTVLLGAGWTNAQNYSVGGSQGLKTACHYTNEQTTTIDTTDIQYENQFLLTATLNNVNYEEDLADPESEAFKFQATTFEEEIQGELQPLLQNPPPSTVTVALDVDVILFRPKDPIGQGSGLTLECVLSVDSDQFSAAALGSLVRNAAANSPLYANFDSTVTASVSYCLREVIMTQEGTITWPVTRVGRDTGTVEMCPMGTKYVGERPLGSRSCRSSVIPPMHAHWDPYICTDCGEILQVDDALEAIYNEIRQNNSLVLDGVRRAGDLLNQVTEVTELGFKWLGLILEHLAGLDLISTELLRAILRLLSNLLQQDIRTFIAAERQYGSSSQMVQALAQLLRATVLDDTSSSSAAAAEFVSIHPNVAAALVDLSPGQARDHWVSFGSVRGPVADAPLNEGSVGLLTSRSLTLLPNCEAYVHLKMAGPTLTGTGVVRAIFVLYHNAKLFQSITSAETPTATSAIAGRVVSADVRASVTPDLTIVSRFILLDPRVTNIECRSWDTGLNDGHGEWSTPACSRDDTEASDRTKCLCNRLGAFTIFAEPSVDEPDHGVNGFVRAGAVICTLCLLAAILLYVVLKTLRFLRETQILGCLFLCLAAFCLFLAIGIDLTGAACLVFGGLMHYCLLAALLWLAIAWLHLYDLSQRKPWTIEWFMLKLSGLVWGIPFLFVVITAVVDPENYHTSTSRCFLSSEPAHVFIITLVVPVVFVLVVVAAAFARTARNVILDQEARPNLDEEGQLAGAGGPSRLAQAWKVWGKHVLYLALVVLVLLLAAFALLLANVTASGAAENIFGCLALLLGGFVLVAFCAYHGQVRRAVLVRLGYANSPESRRFQPYWSTGKWQSSNGPSVLPGGPGGTEAEGDGPEEPNGKAKRLYLDDTQRSGAQTNQGFDPNSIPLSYIEMQRMGIGRDGGTEAKPKAKASNGIKVQADYHREEEEAV